MHWELLYYIVPLIIAGASVLVILGIYLRKFPQLANLDVKTLPQYQQQKKKSALVEDRLARKVTAFKGVLAAIAKPVVHVLRIGAKNSMQRLKTLEERYKKAAQQAVIAEGDETTQKHSVQALLNEADVLINEDKYHEAEKKFIEVIAIDTKSITAYRGLSKVYMHTKQYDHALETLHFLRQLDSKDETIWQNLGMLYFENQQLEEALQAYEQAIELNPKNPKNLDAFIEVAIANKLKYKAQSAIDQLKEVNPDNQKLEQYQKQVTEL